MQILMIYPSSDPYNDDGDGEFQDSKNVPIGILSVATYVNRKFPVKIIDCRLYSKKECIEKISKELPDSICVGISITTPQINHALTLMKYVKSNYDIPIVIGGMHATLFPEQTCKNKYVDFVIYNEGEYSFSELIEKLINNKNDFSHIKGLVYKKDGIVIKNDPPLSIDINELPSLNYALLETERYINRSFHTNIGEYKKFRALDISTSRGCPYQCTFCINTLSYLKKWRGRDMDKVLKETSSLIKKYSLNHLWIMDDFFFADKERAEIFVKHLIKIRFKGTWEANIRANLFTDSLINDKFLKLAKKSGCLCLRMGMESGSDKILKIIRKGITPDQIIHSVKQCKKHGIIPLGTFICAIPEETKEDLFLTAKLIEKIKKIHPLTVVFVPGILRPYPGSVLYQKCKSSGFKEPNSFEGWASKEIGLESYTNFKDLCWVENPKFVINFQIYLYFYIRILTYSNLGKKMPFYLMLISPFIRFRFKYSFFHLNLLSFAAIFINKQIKNNSFIGRLVKMILN